MKTILFSLILFFSVNSYSCPYSSMAEIESKLEIYADKLSNDDLVQILNLKSKGKEALELGNVEKSENYLNNALALFK
mgnify:CR=1 FL=1